MNVSRNEMIAALKRAYEGAGYDIGDYEDAAELITWCEMSGFNIFSNLALPPASPKGTFVPRLVFEGEQNAVIDAGGSDICQYGPLASHLGFSKARKTGFTMVQLINCTHPILILRCLSLIAQHGIYLSVYWQDENGSHGASFESDAMFPNYWCVPEQPGQFEASTVTIICSINSGVLADAVVRQNEQPGAARYEYSAVQLSANYDKALEYGIEVDSEQWNALNAAAWPILVKSTDHSRQGAGPG